MAARLITENTGGTHTGVVDATLWEDGPFFNTVTADPTRVRGVATERKVTIYAITIPNDGAGVVTGAGLTVWCPYADGATISLEVCQILRTPVMNEVNWTEYSSGNNWTTGGSFNTGTDRTAAIWTGSIAFDDNFRTIGSGAALNAAIQALAAGGGTLYLAVNSSPNTDYGGQQFISSSEAADTKRPALSYDFAPSGSLVVTNNILTALPSSQDLVFGVAWTEGNLTLTGQDILLSVGGVVTTLPVDNNILTLLGSNINLLIVAGPQPSNLGGTIITPAKRVGSTIVPAFDFISWIGPSELLISAVCTCTLYSGADPSAPAMISGTASVHATKVIQNVIGGIPGNIYIITCNAQTNTGRFLTQTTYLAVLPDL